ncbi:MAG: ATP-binding protein [Candidatus Omnitrophica bacterium]|nr:ATP-binding protein [Candidatus Omnitrophota bacterium]
MNTQQQEWRKQLQDFGCNPFEGDIVGTPWEEIQDAELIHNDITKGIIRCVNQIRDSNDHKSRSVLIHGFAGSGKSHLLARLRKKLEDQVYFTFVQPMVSDRNHWQYLQRQIIGSLLRPYPLNKQYTQLHYLICRGVEKTLPHEDAPDPYFFDKLKENPTNLIYYIRSDPNFSEKIIRSISPKFTGDIESEHIRILIHFLNSDHRKIAENWLRCMSLDDEDCEQLGLNKVYYQKEYDEELVRSFLQSLFHWSSFDRPIVLCFDQLEQYKKGDPPLKLHNFAEMVCNIVNYIKNVLCLLSLVTISIDDFRKILTDFAIQYRLHIQPAPSANRFALQPFTDPEPIRQLIEIRLSPLHEKLNISKGLFPFEENTPDKILKKLNENNVELYPRYVLNECACEFNKIVFGEGASVRPPLSLSEYLQKKYASQRDFFIQENTRVIDENMEEEQLMRILQCVIDHDESPPIQRILDYRQIHNQDKPWDFEFDARDGRTYAVEVYENGNKTVYARYLTKILDALKSPYIESIYWIRREINSISLGPLGQERMEELEKRGGRIFVNWSEAEWNSIQALIWLLNESAGGNLLYTGEEGSRTVAPEEVERWIAASGVLGDLPIIQSLLTQERENSAEPIQAPAPAPAESAEPAAEPAVEPAVEADAALDLDEIARALTDIVKRQCLIEFDQAYGVLKKQDHFALLSREQCLQALDRAAEIDCNSTQNFQILYVNTKS